MLKKFEVGGDADSVWMVLYNNNNNTMFGLQYTLTVEQAEDLAKALQKKVEEWETYNQ